MVTVTRKSIIRANPEKVWQYLTDTEKELQWRRRFLGTLFQPVTNWLSGGVLARFAANLKAGCPHLSRVEFT